MRTRSLFFHPAILSLALVVPSTALADKGGNGKGHGRGHDKHDGDVRQVVVVESARPRLVAVDASDIRFRGMDRNHDGIVTRREWRGNDQSFRVHDFNRDGILSGRQVRPVRLEARDLRPVDRFVLRDRNRDGVLSLVEWPGTTLSFQRMDRNRDGLVSRLEFFSY